MRSSRQALWPLFLAAADTCTTLQAFRAGSAAYPQLPPRGSRAALLAAAPTGWTGPMLLAQEHHVPMIEIIMIETGRPLAPLLPHHHQEHVYLPRAHEVHELFGAERHILR